MISGEITYRDCANALLKMWMDNVLTDGEYRKIIDRLNAKEGERVDDERRRYTQNDRR